MKRTAQLARVARAIVDAEERVAVKRLEELQALQELRRIEAEPVTSNSSHLYNRGQQALVVARAVRETLLAEKQLGDKLREEAEMVLQVTHDASKAVEDRLRKAERQLGDVLEDLNNNDLQSFLPFPTTNVARPPRLLLSPERKPKADDSTDSAGSYSVSCE